MSCASRLDKAVRHGVSRLVDTVRYGYCGDAEFLDSLCAVEDAAGRLR